uniref:Uncharacterized protein n=1 Tax=Macrostomum lignano TaxID=282301 RepID=A0A1I8HBM8_9PLAT
MRARAWERRSREAASLLREATERLAEARLRVDSEAGDASRACQALGAGLAAAGDLARTQGRLLQKLLLRERLRGAPQALMPANRPNYEVEPSDNADDDNSDNSMATLTAAVAADAAGGSNPPLAAPECSSSLSSCCGSASRYCPMSPLLVDSAGGGGGGGGGSRWSDASYSHSRQAAPLLPQMLN